MGVEDLSIRKRLGLELFRKQRQILIERHPLTYLFWECTLRCNLSCLHCGSDCRKSMEQKDMPLGDFLKVIDTIRPHVDPHKTMIAITGGEPLLRDDIEQCGKELYQREFPWGFVSNGMLISEDKINRLMNVGLRAVTISLDGLERTHNAMRGNNESFLKAINAIRILSSKGDDLAFDVVTCVSKKSFPELSKLKGLLINFGVKSWRIFTIFPIGRASQNSDLQLQPQQFKEVFDFIKNARKEGRIDLSYGCEGFLGNYEAKVRDHFFFCKAGINVGSILIDGSISACPNLRSRFTQGNIYTDDFISVWNNSYQAFRDRSWTKQGECATCKSFRFCHGSGMHLRDEDGKLMFCHLKRIKEGSV